MRVGEIIYDGVYCVSYNNGDINFISFFFWVKKVRNLKRKFLYKNMKYIVIVI